MWYQLLLACAAGPACQAVLVEQLPGILQQLQDSRHGTTGFEVAREVGRASARAAEAEAALYRANASVAQAKQQLQKQLATDRQSSGVLRGRNCYHDHSSDSE